MVGLEQALTEDSVKLNVVRRAIESHDPTGSAHLGAGRSVMLDGRNA
jgi:hypothetical protein